MEWIHDLVNFLKNMYNDYEWFFGLFGVSLVGIVYGLYKAVVWLVLMIKNRRKMRIANDQRISIRKNQEKIDWKKVIPTVLIAITCFFLITASVVVIKHFSGGDIPVESDISNDPIGDVSSEEPEDIASDDTVNSDGETQYFLNGTTGVRNYNQGDTKSTTDAAKNTTTTKKGTTTTTTTTSVTCETAAPVILPNENDKLFSDTYGGNITWELYGNGYLKLTGTGRMDGSGSYPWNTYRYSISIGHGYYIKKIAVLGNITTIGANAFSRDVGSASTVVIGGNVRSIGSSAFEGCPYISTVYYSGTEEQWNAISIASGNENLTNATIYYNS